MSAVDIEELRKHAPTNTYSACSCGWIMSEETDDGWLTWIEHLPTEEGLTPQDWRFLKACQIAGFEE